MNIPLVQVWFRNLWFKGRCIQHVQNTEEGVAPVASLFVFGVSLVDPFQDVDLQSRSLLVLLDVFDNFQGHMSSTSKTQIKNKCFVRKQSQQPPTGEARIEGEEFTCGGRCISSPDQTFPPPTCQRSHLRGRQSGGKRDKQTKKERSSA